MVDLAKIVDVRNGPFGVDDEQWRVGNEHLLLVLGRRDDRSAGVQVLVRDSQDLTAVGGD